MTGDNVARRGCGAPATRICYRGRSKRLWLCANCVYEGRGRVIPYETDVLGKPKNADTHYGAAKVCGDVVDE